MQYRPLGKTGLQASILGFGAMRLPKLDDGTCDFEKAVPILRRAIDLGVTYIDSAHGYINGTSEVAVGKAIHGYDRSRLIIATKIPSNDEEPAKGDVWRAKLEIALKRLDTPYIDVMHFHSLRWDAFSDRVSKPGMALEAALRAKSEGLIHHLAFSCHDTVDNVAKLIDTGVFGSMLVQYNYLDRHNEPAIAHAAKSGMGVVVMGPVAGGRLAIPAAIAGKNDATETNAAEIALRFVWSNPNVTVALSGMNQIAHVEENTAAAARNAALSEDERAQVAALLARNQDLANLYCTGCSYCMPCPNNINIPENFRYMNWYRVWGLEEEAKKAYANLGPNGAWGPWAGKIEGLRAEECLECGECEPLCPQHIPIIEQLKEVAATLAAQEQKKQ
jgi:predicted aldo/keto reductase-like oxidoreductase